MRVILIAAYILIAYYAIRAILRWLLQTPPGARRQDAAGPAEGEMLRDPECGVYVLKERAVVRRIRGDVLYFCGEECAAAHEARGKGS